LPFERLLAARFVARPNRFLVVADRGGTRVRAACRDPGRLRELLRPGAVLRLSAAPRGVRRTRYTVVLVRHGRVWASLVPTLANDVFAAALRTGALPGLRTARLVGREVRSGRSRFDFAVERAGARVLVEVKSATLVQDGVALFPDAPTERGARHARALGEHARAGAGAMIVFIVQRSDARAIRLHEENDPRLAEAVRGAVRRGVRVLAYACRVSPRGVWLEGRLPVRGLRLRR
jgi:sugar fermentation stimulation protein A